MTQTTTTNPMLTHPIYEAAYLLNAGMRTLKTLDMDADDRLALRAQLDDDGVQGIRDLAEVLERPATLTADEREEQDAYIAQATEGLQSILDEILTEPQPTVDPLKAELIAKDAVINDLRRQVEELQAELDAERDEVDDWASALRLTQERVAYRNRWND